jgi:hypothetical protein
MNVGSIRTVAVVVYSQVTCSFGRKSSKPLRRCHRPDGSPAAKDPCREIADQFVAVFAPHAERLAWQSWQLPDVDWAGDGFRRNRRPSLCVTVLMPAQPRPLQDRKILIVEDEAPIALSLASAVAQAGGMAVGPAATVAASFALMADHTLDGALLDIRLRGETSFPLADVLAVLGIPFVFVSGLSSALMPYPHRDRPLFDKPYEMRDVIATLARLLQPAARPASPTSVATPGGGPR